MTSTSYKSGRHMDNKNMDKTCQLVYESRMNSSNLKFHMCMATFLSIQNLENIVVLLDDVPSKSPLSMSVQVTIIVVRVVITAGTILCFIFLNN